MLSIPAEFRRRRAVEPERADWLRRLPGLAADVLAEWQLVVEGDPTYGEAAVVLPVLTPAGQDAVLKLGEPDRHPPHEHLALRAWAGAGAVQLLRADPHRRVLLLERADRDRDLHSVPALSACETIVGLYPRLHRPAIPQLDRLSHRAAHWAHRLEHLAASGLLPRRFVLQGQGLAAELAADPATDGTLVHANLHYANVLATDREPWLAISPRPLSGDPHYEVAPLLWHRWGEVHASTSARGAILDRFHAAVDGAGLAEDRARAWVIVRQLVLVLAALDATERGVPLDRTRITIATTILKAVQR